MLRRQEDDQDLATHQYIDTMPPADLYHDSAIILMLAGAAQITGKSPMR
jgi:hypothetical protein